METIRDLQVVRALAPSRVALLRANPAGGMPIMDVRFSAFNSWYEIDSYWEGQFLERTMPGAFKKTIQENGPNVKVLYDHGFDPQIGNKVLGPIENLREDADSPAADVPLFDTSYNRDLLPGLEAGVYGSSMRFQVMRNEWVDEPEPSEYNPHGLPERTITEVRLFEFGPVTFPANPSATAGIRGMTDWYYERLRTREPRVEEMLVRARALRTPDAGAARQGTPAEGAANSTDAPASETPDTETRVAPSEKSHPNGPAVVSRKFRNREDFLTWIAKT